MNMNPKSEPKRNLSAELFALSARLKEIPDDAHPNSSSVLFHFLGAISAMLDDSGPVKAERLIDALERAVVNVEGRLKRSAAA